MDTERVSRASRQGDPTASTPAASRSGLQSRWLRIALVGGGIAGVLAICVFVLPTPLARWALSRQLEEMGISAEGLDTLKVDLAQGEVWIGPIQFSSSGQEPAQLVEFGFNASLQSLLKRRVLFDRMIVSGLDVHIRHVVDGPVTINGIELTRFLADSSQNTGQSEEQHRSGSVDKQRNGGSGWGGGIDDFEFRDSRLLLTSAEGGTLVVEVERLELQGFRTWTPDQPGTLTLVGEANGIGFKLEGEARPFADVVSVSARGWTTGIDLEKIKRFTGPLIGLEPDQGVLDVRFEGRVSLFPDGTLESQTRGGGQLHDVHVAKAGLFDASMSQGDLDFDLDVVIDGSAGASLRGSAKAVLQQVRAQSDGLAGRAETATIALSDLKLVRGSSAGQARPFKQLHGKLDVELTAAEATAAGARNGADGSEPMRVSAGTVKLAAHTLDPGSDEDRPKDAAALLRIAGSATAENITATLPDIVAGKPAEASVQRAQANLQELSTELVQGAPSKWQARFDAAAVAVSGKIGDDDASAELQKLSVSNARATDALNIAAEALVIENPSLRITRRLLSEMRSAAAEQQLPADQQPAQRLPTLALHRGALVGTGRVRFHDSTLQPAVDLDFEIGSLEMRNIDTGATARPTTFNVAGRLGELSRFSLSGSARPFAEQRNFDVSAHAEGVQLHKFSSYAAQAIGMFIDRGTLQADVDAKATDDRLNAVLNAVVRNLDFVDPDRRQSERYVGTNLPVELVFALLEDEERRIELRVPVSGDLAAPDFDLSQAIDRALTGAVRKVVFGALDLVLFPKTVTQALFNGEEVDSVSRPISFAAGSAELGPHARRVTDRLAKLLEERPKLAVEICGRATAQDLSAYRTRQLNEAMLRTGEGGGDAFPDIGNRDGETIVERARPQLQRLAAERTRAIRQQLLGQGVPASRISECRPSFDAADRGEPGVLVSLQAA